MTATSPSKDEPAPEANPVAGPSAGAAGVNRTPSDESLGAVPSGAQAAPAASGRAPGALGEPAPSNSRFPGTKLRPLPVIDRLSFTVPVRADEAPHFHRWLKTSTAVGTQYNSRIPGFRYAYTLGDGIHLDMGDRASGACKGGGLLLRIDYNPAKQDLAGIGMGRWLRQPWNFTRCDVAIDYEIDLSDALIRHQTLRRSGVITGADGQRETVYLGSRQSRRYFRIYDKKREREANKQPIDAPVLWRVEVEHKCAGQEPLTADLFDGLEVRYLRGADSLNFVTRLALTAIADDPAVLQGADKRTRSRLLKQMREHSRPLDPDPATLYRAGLVELKANLLGTMARAMGGDTYAPQVPQGVPVEA